MSSLYRQTSLALLTDLYEITMAYGYWKNKMETDEACFHLFFRKPPFKGSYAVACGLASVIDFINSFHFDTSDLDYLATALGPTGRPLFEEGFLRYLEKLTFQCDLDCVREGEIVFPYAPLLRISGPIIQCQLLETPLLTLMNFPSLIATKAARISQAAQGDSILEFGLRRAQGIDGGMTAARAAFIGGASATSNVLAGKLYGIPVRGTMAHSWVMAFDEELDSFYSFAEAMPENTIFLVDTFDSLQGVKHAIEVGQWLKQKGKPFLGIRLDSGDLGKLSIKARKMLDEAGFTEAEIYASNELDEWQIDSLKKKGSQIAVWGVGTHLVTGYGQPALDGVYKLSAIRKKGEEWKYRIKLSEELAKTSDPGLLQVRRFSVEGKNVGDVIYDLFTPPPHQWISVDLFDPKKRREMPLQATSRDLLVPIFREGKQVYSNPTLDEMQALARQEISHFDSSVISFAQPMAYPVGMESSLSQLKLNLREKINESLTHH